LWHGAAWHFVAWGALHGVFQIIGRSSAPFRYAICRKIGLPEESRLRKIIQVCLTFALVCFAWIFFRADSIHDALVIITKLVTLPAELAGYVRQMPQMGIMGTVRVMFQLGTKLMGVTNPIKGFGITQCGLAGIFIVILLVSDVWIRKTPGVTKIMQKPLVFRWAGYYALVLITLFSWDAGSSQFIYFTF
jgi:hypothetical protein